jgi:hypothetical protein
VTASFMKKGLISGHISAEDSKVLTKACIAEDVRTRDHVRGDHVREYLVEVNPTRPGAEVKIY